VSRSAAIEDGRTQIRKLIAAGARASGPFVAFVLPMRLGE